MATLKDVKAKVRTLVGDPWGDFATDAYLLPFINQVYEEITTRLMAETGSSFDESVMDVPGVPAGTTDLSTYQNNGPLVGLIDPICLEWKEQGQPDAYYVEAVRTGKLPNVSAAAPAPQYTVFWEWRGEIVYITPLTFAADLRMRGEFSPPPLRVDTDVLVVHPRLGSPVAYAAAALVGVERNNAGYASGYAAQAENQVNDIINLMVRAEQGTTTRIGRGFQNRNWR